MPVVSNYLTKRILEHVFRGIQYDPPANRYVALYKTNPTDADTGVEVTGGGYARQLVTFGPEANRWIPSNNDVEFPEATTDWGTVTHVGIRDALTGGNLLVYGPLASPKEIKAGEQIGFRAGRIRVGIA